jgi:CRP-like cAMP-binding protein
VLPSLQRFLDGEVARLAAAAREVDLPEGEALTAEGEFGHALFAIEFGTANVITDGAIVGTVGA